MTHVDALHKSVASHIDAYKRANAEAPSGMNAVYEYLHKRDIEKAEKVAALQRMFKR